MQTPLQTTLSASDGVFQFNKVDTGNYTFTFTHTGFAEKKQTITIKQGIETKIDPVALSKITATLTEVAVKSQRPLVEKTPIFPLPI